MTLFGVVRTRNLARAALGAVLTLMVAACVPTAENPIVTDGPKTDKDIVGTWHGTSDDGASLYMHVLKRNDDQLGIILVIANDEADARDEWAAFRVVTAQIGEQRYMSALWDLNDGEPVKGREVGYHLLRYSLEPDGSLAIEQVNEEKLVAAVRDGLIPGTIENTDWNEEVRVTASSQELVAYLKTINPEDLFDRPFGRFKLVGKSAAP